MSKNFSSFVDYSVTHRVETPGGATQLHLRSFPPFWIVRLFSHLPQTLINSPALAQFIWEGVNAAVALRSPRPGYWM